MLTNETIRAIHENAVAHGFHEPDSEPTFGEYCALIHEEISEAFSAWRRGEPDEYVDDDGKPQGVWVELADVVIRIGDLIGELEYELRNETDEYKRFYNDIRSMILDEPHEKFSEFTATLHNIISRADMNKSIGGAMPELLAAVICIFARAELANIDLDAVIERKHAYNKTRPYKHGKRM